MPKKTKSTRKTAKLSRADKATNDFHFIVIISVFAALTIFAANYMTQTRQKAIEAKNRQQTLPVAQLEIVTPSPKPTTKPAVPSR